MVNHGYNYIGDVIDDDFTELVREGRCVQRSDFSS